MTDYFAEMQNTESVKPEAMEDVTVSQTVTLAAEARSDISPVTVYPAPQEITQLTLADVVNVSQQFRVTRVKNGLTQADVGRQLSYMNIPGVGRLSQSTICR